MSKRGNKIMDTEDPTLPYTLEEIQCIQAYHDIRDNMEY